MSETESQTRNIGLDLVRVTETAALAAGRWVGSGDYAATHRAATRAMAAALDTLDMRGQVVIGEDNRPGHYDSLGRSMTVGTGQGPATDVVVDPIDGTRLLIDGRPGAISVVGLAPRDTIWSPAPALYMDKIVVDRHSAQALVPDCMDAPAAWTLALVARAKNKAVRDLAVIVLDRPRNRDLINEIRASGARILLRREGDAEGALVAATTGTGVDILMGIGGASQGVIAACAVKALGGGMLARLAPQSEEERQSIEEAGLAMDKILTGEQMVRTNQIFFAATGITTSLLLGGVTFQSGYAETDSLLLRAETGTRRLIHAQHAARIGE